MYWMYINFELILTLTKKTVWEVCFIYTSDPYSPKKVYTL